jgi:hypothetical protein
VIKACFQLDDRQLGCSITTDTDKFCLAIFSESTTVERFLYIRYFTQGVDAKVEIKWSDPIGAHTEINPKGFTQLK